MVRPVLRRRRKKWYVIAARPGTASVPPPLDSLTLPSAAAAYSYRRLKTAYAGSPAEIQREDNSAHQDIGFAGNDFDATAFNNYISAPSTNGHTRTWYDQSGNGNDMAANLAAALPLTNTHGPGVDNNRFGAFTAAGSSSYMMALDSVSIQNIFATGGFIVAVARIQGGWGSTFGAAMASKGTGAGSWEFLDFNNAGVYEAMLLLKASTTDGKSRSNEGISQAVPHIITASWNATTPATPPLLTIDGVACTYISTAGAVGTFSADVGQAMFLFNDQVVNALNFAYGGAIYEVLMFKSIPSAADQTALIANMKTYYGIP